jgi:hypothetical protein
MWCKPDRKIAGRGIMEIAGPGLDPPYASRRANAVHYSTLCYAVHVSFSERSILQSLRATESHVRVRGCYPSPS